MTDEADLSRVDALSQGEEILLQEWTPITVWRNKSAEFSRLPDGDFPGLLPGLAVFRRSTAIQLTEAAPEAVRLPLFSTDGEDLDILHVTSFVDCLDVSESRVKRFPSGKLWRIEHGVFVGSRMTLPGALWRIPEAPIKLLVRGDEPALELLVTLPGLELRRFGEIV